jgi:hypothetical protein
MKSRTILFSAIFFFAFILIFSFGREARAEVLEGTGSCTYIQSYMKYGQANSVIDVVRLQSYLQAIEHIDVPMSGRFDEATREGVKVFQEKYRNEILTPWGGGAATGYAYIKTVQKINEWFCGTSIPLGAKEAQIINAYAVDQAYNVATAYSPSFTRPTVTTNSGVILPGKESAEKPIFVGDESNFRENLASAWDSFKKNTLTSNWFITSLIVLILILAYTGFLLYRKDEEGSVDYEEEKVS